MRAARAASDLPPVAFNPFASYRPFGAPFGHDKDSINASLLLYTQVHAIWPTVSAAVEKTIEERVRLSLSQRAPLRPVRTLYLPTCTPWHARAVALSSHAHRRDSSRGGRRDSD